MLDDLSLAPQLRAANQGDIMVARESMIDVEQAFDPAIVGRKVSGEKTEAENVLPRHQIDFL